MSQLWTRSGLISLLESKDSMTWSHQLKQHSKNTPNVLLMRLDMCGDRHWSDIHNCQAHPTGDGWNRTRSGKSFGLHFHLLQRVVGSWPNVGAPRHVLESVSASGMDSVAHVYVVAHARTNFHVSFTRVFRKKIKNKNKTLLWLLPFSGKGPCVPQWTLRAMPVGGNSWQILPNWTGRGWGVRQNTVKQPLWTEPFEELIHRYDKMYSI